MSNGAIGGQGEDTRRLWVGVIVMAIAGLSMGSDLYMLPALLPSLASDLNLPIPKAARLLSIYAAISAIAAPILVVMFREVNRRTLLLVSIAALAVVNVLVAIAPDSAWLAVTRVVAALAGAILGPIRTATAGQLAPKGRRARAIAIATIGQSAALVIGAPVGTWVSMHHGWRVAFAGAAGVTLVALVGVALFVPSLPSVSRTRLSEQFAVLKNGKVLLVLASNAAALCGIFVLLTFLRVVLEQITVLKATAASTVFALYGIAGTVGNGLAGWAADRMGSVRVMMGGLVVAGLALAGVSLLFLASPSMLTTLLVVVLVAVWGLGAWAYYAIQFNRLVELAPNAPAVAVSWASPATFVGVSVGAWLGGFTLQHGSAAYLGGVAAACFFLGAGCVVATTGEVKAGALASPGKG